MSFIRDVLIHPHGELIVRERRKRGEEREREREREREKRSGGEREGESREYIGDGRQRGVY